MCKKTKETISPTSEAINRMLGGEFSGKSLPEAIRQIEVERSKQKKPTTIDEVIKNLRPKNQV